MSDRAVSPVIATVVLLSVTVLVAAVAGVAVFDFAPPESPPRATFSVSVDSATQTITVVHRGGASVDPERLRLRIAVGGDPVAHQPPVPFFAATGFVSGPSGPFNSAYEGQWVAGQSATLQLASTNTQFRSGALVSVRLYADETVIAAAVIRA